MYLFLCHTVNTRLSFFPSGESNSEIVSDILYIPSSSLPSHVDCEGSGTKYWKGPANINVSVDTDDNPHQHFITDTGYQRLNFSSFFSASNVGSYTCVSEGSTSSIYITNCKKINLILSNLVFSYSYTLILYIILYIYIYIYIYI